jgi:hypothetical protein
MNSLAFDLSTPHGRMMATITSGITEFERELAGIVKPNRAASDPSRLVLSTVLSRPFYRVTPKINDDPRNSGERLYFSLSFCIGPIMLDMEYYHQEPARWTI